MLRSACLLSLVGAMIFCVGCTPPPVEPVEVKPPTVHMALAKTPVKIDGKLDDAVWQSAKSYPMSLSQDKLKAIAEAEGEDKSKLELAEGGWVKYAWDAKNIYVAISFDDTDIHSGGKEDQMHHYLWGDLAEVFIKQADVTWYWEMYCTPTSKRSSFLFPSQGCRVKGNFEKVALPGLKVAAVVDGTVNDWTDKDKGWTAEFAIPVADLKVAGVAFDPTKPWTIFIGRYNYNRYLDGLELSMSPSLSRTSYHLIDEYSPIEFEGVAKPACDASSVACDKSNACCKRTSCNQSQACKKTCKKTCQKKCQKTCKIKCKKVCKPKAAEKVEVKPAK